MCAHMVMHIVLWNSRADSLCPVLWHLSASSPEGSQISVVICFCLASLDQRDCVLWDKPLAEYQVAVKCCNLGTQLLQAVHHITDQICYNLSINNSTEHGLFAV